MVGRAGEREGTPHRKEGEMAKECWCVEYHHPEYSTHPENEGWACECCERGHALPFTDHVDMELDRNARVMESDVVSPFPTIHSLSRLLTPWVIVHVALAEDIPAAVSGITRDNICVAVESTPTTESHRTIAPTRAGKSFLHAQILEQVETCQIPPE